MTIRQKIHTGVTVFALTCLLGGCSDMNRSEKGALIGGGAGAAGGALIGGLTGAPGTGAIVGGTAGAIGGAVAGHERDRRKRD